MDATLQTDELPIGHILQAGKYIITGINPASRNSHNYTATTTKGQPVSIKEFFLSDLNIRQGFNVVLRNKQDRKLFKELTNGFLRDAKFLTALESKNIAPVISVFKENQTAYLVSVVPQGTLLSEFIEAGRANFEKGAVIKIATDLASALIEVHGFGMLHRDVSPRNIMIAPDGNTVLLPDFGTFREDRSKVSRVVSSVVRASEDYAPYELIFDDARQGDGTDLYCMAAVIYRLITGQAPTPSLERISALAEEKPDPFLPLAQSGKAYPEPFLQAVDMALELFLENRLYSAGEFLRLIAEDGGASVDTAGLRRSVQARSDKIQRDGIVGRVMRYFGRRSR